MLLGWSMWMVQRLGEEVRVVRAASTAGSGGGRRGVLVVAAGALLVVVAVGSRARMGSSGGVVHPLGLRVVGDVVVSVLGVLLLAGVVLWVAAFVGPRRRGRPAEEESVMEIPSAAWWERLLLAGLPVAVWVFVVLVLVRSARSGPLGDVGGPLGGLPVPGGAGSRSPGGPVGGGVDGPVVGAVVVGVAVGGAVAVVVGRRRRGLATPEPDRARVGLGAVRGVGLEELLGEVDPRRAVIRAYGAMTALLGSWGLPRRLSETPFEFLERALVGLGASAGAARRLTVLFERAKFSDHPIEESHRTEAVDAVRGLRRVGDGG